MRPLSLLALCVLAGCTVGAPPGFSSGDSWTAPLVGPLEGGPLLVPVKINGQGPYLFLIDTDAPVSQVDEALAGELQLHVAYGQDYIDEQDTSRGTKTAEVPRVELGTLTVRSKVFWLMTVGRYNSDGRQVRGVIGRDILADSLVFGFDRQRGIMHLATQKGFTQPEPAIAVGYRREKTRVTEGVNALSRRLTHATINGKEFTVHLDFGAVESQLRESKWAEAGLVGGPVDRTLVDEIGTPRKVTQAAVAQQVTLGDAVGGAVLFVPYVDKRWNDRIYDGTLGLNFFAGVVVWDNMDKNTLYLTAAPQGDLLQERIARWGSEKLSECAVPACTTAKLLVPEAPAADPAADPAAAPAPVPAAQPILRIERTADVADLPFEVLIEVQSPSGAPMPRILAIFPAGATELTQALDASFAGATFSVIDVSPFPRACKNEGACAYLIGGP